MRWKILASEVNNMATNTNETAKAILARDRDKDELPWAHLDRMAKLWLMRDEIISEIDMLDYDQEHERAANLITKIKEIGE